MALQCFNWYNNHYAQVIKQCAPTILKSPYLTAARYAIIDDRDRSSVPEDAHQNQ